MGFTVKRALLTAPGCTGSDGLCIPAGGHGVRKAGLRVFIKDYRRGQRRKIRLYRPLIGLGPILCGGERFATCMVFRQPEWASKHPAVCRMQFGDTADYKSALQLPKPGAGPLLGACRSPGPLLTSAGNPH
jgi:hypothetical protein